MKLYKHVDTQTNYIFVEFTGGTGVDMIEGNMCFISKGDILMLEDTPNNRKIDTIETLEGEPYEGELKGIGEREELDDLIKHGYFEKAEVEAE